MHKYMVEDTDKTAPNFLIKTQLNHSHQKFNLNSVAKMSVTMQCPLRSLCDNYFFDKLCHDNCGKMYIVVQLFLCRLIFLLFSIAILHFGMKGFTLLCKWVTIKGAVYCLQLRSVWQVLGLQFTAVWFSVIFKTQLAFWCQRISFWSSFVCVVFGEWRSKTLCLSTDLF